MYTLYRSTEQDIHRHSKMYNKYNNKEMEYFSINLSFLIVFYCLVLK